jgi:hypothetical protein
MTVPAGARPGWRGRLAHLVRTESPFVLAVVVGTVLRLHEISYQIVADDEWHGLQTALYGSYAYVVTHVGAADYCIPLTVYYKLMLDTVGLSEFVMRAPVLIAGIAALVVLPWLVRPWIGRHGSVLFVWLLAIAPMHVYYSRYARPYSVALFLAIVALVAFDRWWRGGRRAWAVTYAGCAVGATYSLMVIAPFVLAPLAWALADSATRPDSDRSSSMRRVVRLGAVVGGALAVLLVGPLWLDRSSIALKLHGGGVTSATIAGAIRLLAGTSRWWLVALVIAAMAVGVATMRRGQPRRLGYLVFVCAAQSLALLILRPTAIEMPITLARYNLPLLPVGLLFVAVGVTRVDALVHSRWPGYRGGIPGAVLCGLLLSFGPLSEIYYRPNSWTNHALFQYAWPEYERLKPPEIPAFYSKLAQRPPESIRIVEAPWFYEWHKNAYPYYQRLHRQRMFVGMVDDLHANPRAGELPKRRNLAFENYVDLGDALGLQQRRVTYVVFHKNFALEIPRGRLEPMDVTRWVARYRQAYGRPVYEDRHLVVFDVSVAPIEGDRRA